jgi:hypothetical protein
MDYLIQLPRQIRLSVRFDYANGHNHRPGVLYRNAPDVLDIPRKVDHLFRAKLGLQN